METHSGFFMPADAKALHERLWEGSAAVTSLPRPFALSQDRRLLVFVQACHLYESREGGRFSWHNTAPQEEDPVGYLVVISRRYGNGAFSTRRFPLPAAFGLERLALEDGDIVFVGEKGRVAGSADQVINGMLAYEYNNLEGYTLAEVEAAFLAIPAADTTPEPVPKPMPGQARQKDIGTLVYKPEFKWYEASVCGVDFMVHAREAAMVRGQMAAAGRIVRRLDELRESLAAYAAQELLALKNDSWLEKGQAPLTPEGFAGRLRLLSVEVENETGTFYFDDGDLFWGHTVLVECSYALKPVRAEIAG